MKECGWINGLWGYWGNQILMGFKILGGQAYSCIYAHQDRIGNSSVMHISHDAVGKVLYGPELFVWAYSLLLHRNPTVHFTVGLSRPGCGGHARARSRSRRPGSSPWTHLLLTLTISCRHNALSVPPPPAPSEGVFIGFQSHWTPSPPSPVRKFQFIFFKSSLTSMHTME